MKENVTALGRILTSLGQLGRNASNYSQTWGGGGGVGVGVQGSERGKRFLWIQDRKKKKRNAPPVFEPLDGEPGRFYFTVWGLGELDCPKTQQ